MGGKNKKNGKKNKSEKEEIADSKTESARIRSPPKHPKISRRTKSKKSMRTESGVTEEKVKESENEYDQNDENGDMMESGTATGRAGSVDIEQEQMPLIPSKA